MDARPLLANGPGANCLPHAWNDRVSLRPSKSLESATAKLFVTRSKQRNWPTALGPRGRDTFQPHNHDVFFRVTMRSAVFEKVARQRPSAAATSTVATVMESAIAVILAGLQVGAIYALVGLSYVVLINATGLLNFGQGEWLMVAAMLGLSLLTIGTPYWIAVIGSILGAVGLFLICGRLVIRPCRIGKPH